MKPENRMAKKVVRPTARSENVTFVVKNGVRKARSIRKFQDSYYVGIAYAGLMQLDKGVDEYGNTCWEGKMVVENPISNITIYVDVYNEIKERTGNYVKDTYYDTGKGYYRNHKDWDDDTQYSPEDVKLWEDNMEGISESFFKFSMYYFADSLSGSENKYKRIFEYKSDYDYYSIEDVLDAITQKSEDAWSDVNIFLNDNAQTYQNIKDTKEMYPQTLSLTLPTGESLTLRMGDGYGSTKMGNWHASKEFKQDNIYAHVDIYVRAVTSNGDGSFSDEDEYFGRYHDTYSVSRNDTLEYYAVDVLGKITDHNTQTNADRGGYEHSESWERNFTGQGSQTIEGAIAIAESNIAEVYQEWTEFVNSERNYVKVGHGQGYRRTVENTEPWDYNFGDSQDDVNYDNWQGYDLKPDAPISIPGSEWDGGWGWNVDDADYLVFLKEYVGENNMRYYTITDDGYFKSRWNGSGDIMNAEKYTQGKTREDVERVANFMGLKLLDYTNPYTFRLGKGVKKSRRPYAYYDIDVKKMRKSISKPKSFNSMVKSIRQKNQKKKVI